MRLTLDEIYRQGLEALRNRLGRAGMIRFLLSPWFILLEEERRR